MAGDNWTTPEWLTRLLPVVDLDPCSNPHSTVRARQALSLENGDDGLLFAWAAPESGVASVFCNPPYSRGQVDRWARKVVDFIQVGPSRWAVALVKLDPTTAWWRTFHSVPCRAYPLAQRLRFGGAECGAPFTSCLLLLSRDEKVQLPMKLLKHTTGCLEPFPWGSE